MSTKNSLTPLLQFKSLVKVFHITIHGVYKRFKCLVLQLKYKENAFDKTFDWNWKKTNFNRIALVNRLVQKYTDCEYLEIGCASNQLYDSVPVSKKIGVDPQSGGNYRNTSDNFFKENKSYFDVIFIDGLHTYEQVRKDVINSIKFLKPGGFIALHDMLPKSWIEHHIPVLSPGDWTGDVWKIAFELTKTQGIDFKIVKIDHGVGVLRLTETNPSLINLMPELIDKQFSYLYENINTLPLVEWNDFEIWLNNSQKKVRP